MNTVLTKDNNNIKNLMLFSSQSAHVKFEKYGLCLTKDIIFDGREL